MQLNLCMTCSILMWSYFRIRKDVRNVLGKWYTKKRSFLKSLSELATFSKHKTYQFLLATCLPKDDGDDVTCVISRHVHWLIFFFGSRRNQQLHHRLPPPLRRRLLQQTLLRWCHKMASRKIVIILWTRHRVETAVKVRMITKRKNEDVRLKGSLVNKGKSLSLISRFKFRWEILEHFEFWLLICRLTNF